ncbi:ATP-binding domain-containing protein [Paenibacillus oceani]|uniref:ATP-binding domain-containing protein n=1 Tax=Paenibacillus oceani TaxID=2772510 RepID=UPI001CC257DA|nr:ATP-binding domain-containing protein [Paenibacillus oceani]
MAKGLEFDQVIVPSVDASNYRTELDRSLLYIACTRAMHALTLTFHGVPSLFIAETEV